MNNYNNEDVFNFASKGDVDNLIIAIKQCNNSNWFKNDRGLEAIHIAVRNNHTKCIEFLIQSGADIEKKTVDGSSPLNFAAFMGHVESIRLLCDHGANINSTALW